MAYDYTPAQQLAINTRNKSLLVSAAAGSGKTATLTERIIRSLTDKDTPVDIDSLLVVTFTRAAASELRQRISSSLSDALAADPTNKHLSEQLIKMSGAKISTIDSFSLEILRSNFDKLDISPSFRTADESELDVLAKSLMEDTIDDFYEAHPNEFSKITECFVNVRNNANLSNIFLDLYSKTESLPDGIGFLKKAADRAKSDAEKDLLDGSFGVLIANEIREAMNYYISALSSFAERFPELDTLPFYVYDVTFAETLIKLVEAKCYEDCYTHIVSYAPLRRPNLSKIGLDGAVADTFVAMRDSLKEKIKSLTVRFFSVSPKNISAVMQTTADITLWIYQLLSDFEARFDKEKRQKNVMSFTDIRRAAFRLLVNPDGSPTSTAIEYSNKFSQIYIDEYQDVDLVQDLMFSAISRPEARFMVGDIKQSIYVFRGAEPDVFANYRKLFPDIGSEAAKDSSCASIFMSNNFRCDSTVIDFANKVCSSVFEECTESIGYSSEDKLIFTKSTKDRVIDETPVELTVIVPDDEDDNVHEGEEAKAEKGKQTEAKYIASRIAEILRDGKKADGTPILPHDIAVLYRAKNMGEYLSKELGAIGISSSSDADTDYFENPDVLLVLCLLNAIDNPQRDVYLAGLLRSPLFEFSLNELVKIRSAFDHSHSLYDCVELFADGTDELSRKCMSFCETLSSFRDAATAMPVDKLLKHLYSTDIFLAAGLFVSDPSSNLIRLYEYARKFEASSFKGLYNFISYINKMIEEKKKLPAEADVSCEGKVSLLSIHHSKGLEFPVCFVCCTGSAFYMPELAESLVFDSHFGAAMKISDSTGFGRVNTPMREALITAMRKKRVEEEMRVLYVALTRAREKLIVTGSSRSKYDSITTKASLNRAFKCRYSVLSSTTYLDWILTALDPEGSYPYCNISFIKKQDIVSQKQTSNTEALEDTASDTTKAEEILRSRFSFVYPHRAATTLPAKISVSALLDAEKDEDTVSIFDEDKAREYFAPSILEGKTDSNISPTQRGTATHLFLQFCDFEKLKTDGVDAEIKRLIDRRFIPSESEQTVFKNELEAFLKSELFTKITNAKKLYREQRFNIVLPTSMLNSSPEFLEETKDEFLAVQGVIDLIIEEDNGNIFLYDYKTDRLSREELTDDEKLREKMLSRHEKQIGYYAEAVKRLFGKECSGAFIYSTHKASLIEIPI